MDKSIGFRFSPWAVCVPMLLILIITIAFTAANVPLSDGIRYWQSAGYFLNGFSNIDIINSSLLWNGPFYPFFLFILRLLSLGVKESIFFNAIFIYLAGVLLFKLLRKHLSFIISVIVIYSWYFIDPFLFYWGAKLYSEPLAIFLIVAFMYKMEIFIKTKSNRDLVLTSLLFSSLILTRVLFGYVCIALILIFGLFYLVKKQILVKNILKIFLLSFLFITPYLAVTYKITGKHLYFSNGGGTLLYWISSPHKNDLGEWHVFGLDNLKDHLGMRYNKFSGLDSTYLARVNEVIIDQMKNDHATVIEKINSSNFNAVEQDEFLKKEALNNISKHPINFTKNWLLNCGRLFIGYPHAIYFKPPYSPLLSLLNILKSTLVIALFVFASVLFFLYSLKGSLNLFKITFLIITLYLGGQSLLAVQSQRFLLPVYPIIVYFTSIQLNRHLKFKS